MREWSGMVLKKKFIILIIIDWRSFLWNNLILQQQCGPWYFAIRYSNLSGSAPGTHRLVIILCWSTYSRRLFPVWVPIVVDSLVLLSDSEDRLLGFHPWPKTMRHVKDRYASSPNRCFVDDCVSTMLALSVCFRQASLLRQKREWQKFIVNCYLPNTKQELLNVHLGKFHWSWRKLLKYIIFQNRSLYVRDGFIW